ncbi:MAG TPA: ABC transporter permease [Vicinamibacterales bacterium]|jgi:lipooligosaccharide transport system permease protein|nr:ABC transporter permease [Vicinamibacterales bacterium]
MTRAIRVVQRNALVYKHVWRGSLFSSFLQPTLFLLSLGVGVGALVDTRRAAIAGGASFLQFLAPGLLAAACMQTGSIESSWPVTGKMVWRRNYQAMTATPLRVDDVVLGELVWLALRLSTVGIAFATVSAAFGALRPTAAVVPAIGAAVLTGLAVGAPVMAYAATLKSGGNFNVIFRFVLTPLFLFSGVFFPVEGLPSSVRWIAWLSPLYHGVQIVRGLTVGVVGPPRYLVHVAYLSLLLAAGFVAACVTFRRKLYS